MAKEKVILEYDMRNTPVALLWSYIATASGLKEWFADDVEMQGREFRFIWNGSEQTALIVGMRTEKYVRMHWVEEQDKFYFELKISVSELTDGVVLSVMDWAEPEDVQETTELWNYQVDALRRILGCI